MRGTFNLVLGISLVVLPGTILRGESWPTHRHDVARSGYTSESMGAGRLQEIWRWQSPLAPVPAWDGPARWDAYARIRELPAMRQYDAAFQSVTDGERLFFGSSSQDTLFAVDLNSGEPLWRFVAGGPIRLAPTIDDGKVYFGCDDGFVYCRDAKTGSPIWQFNPAEHVSIDRRFLLNDERIISTHPIRTSVLVSNGIAYFGAGLLPWRDHLACAVDAESGLPEGPGTFVLPNQDVTMEGPLLATEDRLVFPQGRAAPLIFDRRTGKSQGALPGGGGITIVLTDEGDMVRAEGGNADGKGTRGGQIGVFRDKERVASFPRGRSMVVRSDSFYVVDDKQLFAAERRTNKLKWKCKLTAPLEVIMAGTTLFVGCQDQVVAIDARTGKPLWQAPLPGRAFGLLAANKKLIVSTDRGTIHCFGDSGTLSDPPNVELAEVRFDASSEKYNQIVEDDFLSWGPVARFVSPGVAEVTFGTRRPLQTGVSLDDGQRVRRFDEKQATTHHQIRIDGLPRRRICLATVQPVQSDTSDSAATFIIDTHFDWSTQPVPQEPTAAMANLIEAATNPRGIALVLGGQHLETAVELARSSHFRVVLVESSSESAGKIRSQLGIRQDIPYGGTISVVQADPDELPAAFAAIVVSSHDTAVARRLVRPEGGVLAVDSRIAWTRPALPGAGEWGHMYGSEDNSGFGGEQLGNSLTRDEMTVQWIGRPGPRYQSDRQNRKPSPLAAGGRLYLQGLQRIIAMDAFSGSILWNLESPSLMRWNVPHDCSNWCADGDNLYVASGDRAWIIEGSTGNIQPDLKLPGRQEEETRPKDPMVWGYIARHGGYLLGTKVRRSAIYTDWWGGEKWFDSIDGHDTEVVTGETLFAYDLGTGKLAWTYDGLLLHPTISVLNEKIYFVQDNTPANAKLDKRRLPIEPEQNLVLVCLDATDGSLQWQRDLTPRQRRSSCIYLVASRHPSGDKLVMSTSAPQPASKTGFFSVDCFEAASGEPIWNKSIEWEANHHGKHISRPAVQGDLIYLRPEVLDVQTGERITRGFPSGHGCTSYALCENGLFSRLGSLTWWDPRTEHVSRFPRIRTDCWISSIPAQGLLLSPEGGGGCSCGTWLETSVAFLPDSVNDLQLEISK